MDAIYENAYWTVIFLNTIGIWFAIGMSNLAKGKDK